MMAQDSRPIRPDSLPAQAEWNAKENEWELGEKNADGKEMGPWIWWAPDGSLVCKAVYDGQGALHGRLERWHPNGEIAQWADWIHGKTHGMQVWTLATTGKSDKSSVFPPNVGDDVFRMDMPYDRGRPQLYHFTFYKREGLQDSVPCDEDGRSIDLGQHLDRVAPETTLHLLTRYLATVDGNHVQKPEEDSARWIFQGPEGANWRVNLTHRTKTSYVVSTEEMSRAFTLSADYYLASLKEKRPKSVPEEAVWNIEDETWELGGTNEKHRVGPWRIWDKHGKLRKRMNYTRYGALHGDVEHDHADGTPAFRATYFKGEQIGSAIYTRCKSKRDEEFVPAADNVWRCEIETHDGREVRKYFLRNNKACNRFGIAAGDAYRDALFVGNTPDTFLESGFEEFLASVRVDDSEKSGEVQTEVWADLWGQEMHPDLRLFLRAVLKNQAPGLSTYDFQERSDLLFFDDRENAMEALIREAQKYPTNLALHEVFFGAVSLGNDEGKNIYLVTSCHRSVQEPQVLVFDRPTMKIAGPFTKDLGHFAYLITSADACFGRETLSHEAMTHVWTQLNGAWTPWGPWLANSPRPQAVHTVVEDDALVFQKASGWIVDLLRGAKPLEDIAREINLNDWPVFDSTNWQQNVDRAQTDVPFGLHALWRLFFCKKDHQLGDLIAVCADSPARILRDAAAILYEIQWGEESLGNIEDIYELREEFWRLGVLPESVEESLDTDPTDTPHTPKFRKLLSGIAWSREPERFWDIAMAADLASDEQRKQALLEVNRLRYLEHTLMPVVRFAAKRLGGDISDVRQWVRTALAKETNPPMLAKGRAQNIWALRVAGEDDSIEVDVIQPWTGYDDDGIRAAAVQAMQKRLPDFQETQFWGDEVRALIEQAGAKSARTVAEHVEKMLERWVPFATEAPTPEILDIMMASLAQSNDESAWTAAATKCLNHSENLIVQAALRVCPPHDSSLLTVMAKHEEIQTGHARRIAREWLETYPDQDAANAARDL